jgi:hypothetical protein
LPQVHEERYHRDFLEIPQINSFVTLCQPFAAALQDLLSSDPRHASTLLKAAMQAIARFPSPLPSILCHILFLSFPVTSPLVGNLVACIRDAKVKLCAHCCEELENYTLFMRETPHLSFNRSGFELEFFKGRHEDEIPKITPLGEPCHYPIKYSSKLLQSSLINQQTPQAPIHISHLEDHSHASSISTDFFCGSHSGNKPHTLFLQKVLKKHTWVKNRVILNYLFINYVTDESSSRIACKSCAKLFHECKFIWWSTPLNIFLP